MFFRRPSFLSRLSGRSGNRSRKASALVQRSISRAVAHCAPIEALEDRRLLTTITGPFMDEYLDGEGNTIRVRITGNMTAELIGLWVADADNEAPLSQNVNILTDMIEPFTENILTPDDGDFLPGAYLYSIYIASADINSSISIAMVPAQSQDGSDQDRPMQAFGGATGSFNVFNANTGDDDEVSPAGQSGAVLLGARTGNTIEGIDDEEEIGITSQVLKKNFGVRPRTPKGKIDAGISTAPGVDVGQILIGGTVIGRVSITGSCNLFYAGQIWTGDIRGIDKFSTTVPRNFEVGGDLRTLVTIGSIGTDAIDDSNLEDVDYKTGFDLRVKGRLGQIMTKDSFMGAVQVTNDKNFLGPGTAMREVEVRGAPKENDDSFFEGNQFLFGRLAEASLGDNPIFNNDTSQTAEFVGTAHNSNFGGQVLAEIEGSLDANNLVNDDVDYYAIALLAGQTAEVELTGLFNVGVFDPDGRIIASDYSNTDVASVSNLPFRFAADRPGVYRFAVAYTGDINFNGALDGGETITRITAPYTLRIDRVADIALGGVVASQNIATTDALDPDSFFDGIFTSFTVENGDLGAIISTGAGDGGGGGDGQGTIFSAAAPFTVTRGNLRVMEAGSIAITRDVDEVPTILFGPDLRVPKGSVGLLRATGADQALDVNSSFVTPGGSFDPDDAIGFDYQLVDAAGIFSGDLLADRGIGTVRADQFSTTTSAPRIAANADNVGNDGFIDLLDARTSFGTLEAGGPAITTGTGGNVKYIRTQGAIFRDRFFGGGELDFTRLAPGVPFRYTDDSGTSVKITPLPIIPNGQDQFTEVGLTVQTYGIRDKGGSALTFVAINAVITIDGVEQASGILVDTGNVGGGGAEIGEINLNNLGSATTFITQRTNPTTGLLEPARDFVVDSTDALPSTLEMKGRAPVSVFSIRGTNINLIDNRTSGEMVNLTAESLGTMQGNNIGVAVSKTKAKIEGVDVVRDVFPFSEQRTLINVNGAIQAIRARGQLGNVFSNTTIGEVTANEDGADQRGVTEGIMAPISATNSILNVQIGELLAHSGYGDFAQGGIFAGGVIASVRNQGKNSDIRGDIVAAQGSILPAANGLPGVAGIGEIKLINGSIIDADIMVARLTDSLDLPRSFVFPGSTSFFFPAVIPNIGDIIMEGNGGVIGSLIGGDSIGVISNKSGFGVINSRIILNASGTFEGIDTDGYGIRLTTINGGATVNSIVARGNGQLLDTRAYTITVRQSESLSFDPFSGRLLTGSNDLHRFLGTTGTSPKNPDTSSAGTIEDSTFTGGRDLENLSAFRVFGRPFILDPVTDTPAMRISFAENIGDFLVAENINGLNLTAGSVKTLQAGRDFLNTRVNVSGRLHNLISGNNIKGSTIVEVQGNEGSIGTIRTKRALFGRVSAATRIDNIIIGTDLGSPSLSSSNDIGTATINGSILSGGMLRAADQIATLIIHGSINEGGVVRAKRIGTQTIDGAVAGDIIIG